MQVNGKDLFSHEICDDCGLEFPINHLKEIELEDGTELVCHVCYKQWKKDKKSGSVSQEKNEGGYCDFCEKYSNKLVKIDLGNYQEREEHFVCHTCYRKAARGEFDDFTLNYEDDENKRENASGKRQRN